MSQGKEISAQLKVTKIFPVLASRRFIILALTFSSVVHFDLILYMASGKGLGSFCFAYGSPVVPEPFVEKDYPFSVELPCHLCKK